MTEGSLAFPIIQRTITTEQIARYAEASGDNNPLHLDPAFASQSQFGVVVAHGMLTLAFVSEMLTGAFGRHWLESGRLKVRLKAPAYPGDELRTWGEVVREDDHEGTRKVVCAVGLKDGNDRELIAGDAVVHLPARESLGGN
ncbi:MAG: MaoC family dehydratase [Dehalococcoidia bacterium]|nr:MaoC family dehydratase [Dehalococcoidia bacterium]